MTTLNACLQSWGFQGNYTQLYRPQGGYLRYKGGSWNLSYQPIHADEKDKLFSEITAKLCEENLAQLPNNADFIARVNEVFLTRHYQTVPNELDKIFFNSREVGYEYLSNFFHTLIVDSQGQVYPSAEAYYQHQLMSKLQPGDLHAIQVLNPLAWKKLGEYVLENYMQEHPGQVEAVNKLRVGGMHQVVARKFQQNPVLNTLLQQTHPCELIEFSTSDRFFGANKQSEGENHLGKILMDIRRAV